MFGGMGMQPFGMSSMSPYQSSYAPPTSSTYSQPQPTVAQPVSSQSPQPAVQNISNTPNTSQNAPVKLFTPKSLIIAQPANVARGRSILVSWTSVGMDDKTPCTIYANDTQMAEGNSGTQFYRTDANTPLQITFSQKCISFAGNPVSVSTNVTLK
jgi:hypothetical protein